MERMKTWMTVLLVLCVAMAVTMKENMVGLLLGMWASEPNTFPYNLDNRLQASQVRFAGELMGPESLAFDREGRGPYTGVSDGRILRWDGPRNGWFHFAHTSPHRDAECAPKDQPTPNFEYEHICGRPLGLRFDNSGTLFIADAYYGLLSVGLNGGLAVPLVTHVEGANLTFTNDLDFDAEGFLYFTESSSIHQRREFLVMFIDGDNSGKLIRYDPRTGTTKILLRGLQFPNGVSISKDETFLLISETITCRLLRYWLKGPKTGSVEVFAFLPGYPDNVRLNDNGDFWVAIHAFPNPFLKIPVNIRRLILRIPLPWTQIFSKVSAKRGRGMIIRYGIDGQVLEVLEDRDGLVVKSVSGVEEKDGLLWLGSVLLPHIVVYNRNHHGYSHM